MFKQNISVKDQFGVQYAIQATVDPDFVHTQSDSNVKHITVEGENIRPSFEMFFSKHHQRQNFQNYLVVM